jgi:hypothetical protein
MPGRSPRGKIKYLFLFLIFILALFVLIKFWGKANSQIASQTNATISAEMNDEQSHSNNSAKTILSNEEVSALGDKMRKYAERNVELLAERFKGNMSLVAYELANQIKSEFGVDKVNQWVLAYRNIAESEKKACLLQYSSDSTGKCARIGKEDFDDIVWHPIYDACQKYLAKAEANGSDRQINHILQATPKSSKTESNLTKHDKCIHHAAFIQSTIDRRDAGLSPEDSLRSLPLYVADGKPSEIEQKNLTKYMINLVYFDADFKSLHGKVFDSLYLACMGKNGKQFEPLKYERQ